MHGRPTLGGRMVGPWPKHDHMIYYPSFGPIPICFCSLPQSKLWFWARLLRFEMLPPTVSSIFVFVFTMNQPATQDLLKMNGTAKSSPNSGGDTLLWLVMLFYVLVTVICIGLLATLQQVP